MFPEGITIDNETKEKIIDLVGLGKGSFATVKPNVKPDFDDCNSKNNPGISVLRFLVGIRDEGSELPETDAGVTPSKNQKTKIPPPFVRYFGQYFGAKILESDEPHENNYLSIEKQNKEAQDLLNRDDTYE